MPVYFWETNSNAAPFFSDPNSGFIEAETAMDALKEVVEKYDHPCGLYAAIVKACEPKSKVLARYLSAKAVATEEAIKQTEGGIIKENGKIQLQRGVESIFIDVKDYQERWENLENP